MKHYFVLIHRWAGIVLCLFFAMWFASGIVLIYVPFPSLSHAERFDKISTIDFSKVSITPSQAITAANSRGHSIDKVRLVDRASRPVYIIEPANSPVIAIWADSGLNARIESTSSARQIAEHYNQRPISNINDLVNYDQWVVHNGFDRQRPFYRIYIDDEAGSILYLSQHSGEFVQETQRSERLWNYVGAVVHWIYPTILRKNWAAWDRFVWVLALIGIGVTVLGIYLGIIRSQRAYYLKQKLSLYRGWLRWHHIAGLFAGVIVFNWIFSGWLSMDHGRLFSAPDAAQQQVENFRGITLDQAVKQISLEFINSLKPAQELEIGVLAGSAVTVTRTKDNQLSYWFADGHMISGAQLPHNLMLRAVNQAWPDNEILSSETITADDRYSQLRQSKLAGNTLRVKLDDDKKTWIHIDQGSGQVIALMDKSRRLYRWLYNGLHSLDIPGLSKHRPLWDIIIVSCMLLGLLFSLSAVVLAYKRLRLYK